MTLEMEDLDVLLPTSSLLKKTTRGNVRKQLRQSVDGNESFMNAFLIGRKRRYTRKRPPWVTDDVFVAALLRRAFPHAGHRKKAGRWMRIIQLYYRLGYTCRQVAEELGEPMWRVRFTINDIRVAAKRANHAH